MKVSLCVFLILFSFISFCQSDLCRDVLIVAGTNTSIEVKNAYLAKSIYDEYCSGSSERSGKSFSANLPIKLGKLGLSGGSTRQKLQTLCKSYESEYKEIVNTYSFEKLLLKKQLTLGFDVKS